MLQARPHAAGNQHLNRVQRMRFVRRTLVKRLFDGQFQQLPAGHLALFDLVDPEFTALAGMFGDRAAILAGDGNFHVDVSFANSCETFNAMWRPQIG
jgi:hypothetical protein